MMIRAGQHHSITRPAVSLSVALAPAMLKGSAGIVPIIKCAQPSITGELERVPLKRLARWPFYSIRSCQESHSILMRAPVFVTSRHPDERSPFTLWPTSAGRICQDVTEAKIGCFTAIWHDS